MNPATALLVPYVRRSASFPKRFTSMRSKWREIGKDSARNTRIKKRPRHSRQVTVQGVFFGNGGKQRNELFGKHRGAACARLEVRNRDPECSNSCRCS